MVAALVTPAPDTEPGDLAYAVPMPTISQRRRWAAVAEDAADTLAATGHTALDYQQMLAEGRNGTGPLTDARFVHAAVVTARTAGSYEQVDDETALAWEVPS